MPPGPPNMVATVRRFATAVTLRRFAPTTVSTTAGSRGLKVLGAATDTAARAHWWDDPSDASSEAPEGKRSTRRIAGATDVTDLRTTDEDQDLPADCFVIDGVVFEVVEVTRWSSGASGVPTWVSFRAVQIDTRGAVP